MESIRLPRTGLPDLEFIGECMAASKGADDDGATAGRWHDISVYRAEDGEYIVGIHFHSDNAGEVSDDIVETAAAVEEVEHILSLYVPTARVAASGPTDEERRRTSVLETLTRRYDLQVHQVLMDVQRSVVAST